MAVTWPGITGRAIARAMRKLGGHAPELQHKMFVLNSAQEQGLNMADLLCVAQVEQSFLEEQRRHTKAMLEIREAARAAEQTLDEEFRGSALDYLVTGPSTVRVAFAPKDFWRWVPHLAEARSRYGDNMTLRTTRDGKVLVAMEPCSFRYLEAQCTRS